MEGSGADMALQTEITVRVQTFIHSNRLVIEFQLLLKRRQMWVRQLFSGHGKSKRNTQLRAVGHLVSY